jgi:hypothetical protein
MEEERICYHKEEPSIYWSQQNHEEESSPIFWSQHFHEEESALNYWPQQYQEKECQNQLVATPNGHYMEDECTNYQEQAVTLKSEEVVENQVEERKEEQIEVPQEPHWERRSEHCDFFNINSYSRITKKSGEQFVRATA